MVYSPCEFRTPANLAAHEEFAAAISCLSSSPSLLP
jgi:hypothetical protein